MWYLGSRNSRRNFFFLVYQKLLNIRKIVHKRYLRNKLVDFLESYHLGPGYYLEHDLEPHLDLHRYTGVELEYHEGGVVVFALVK